MKDKVVIVTGAAGGIGLATCKEFAKKGARVVLAGRTLAKLEEAARELPGDGYLIVEADVSKEDDVIAMFERTVEKFGRVDIIFNNAGNEGVIAKMGDYPMDVFDKVVNINLRGTFLCMKYAIRYMLKQGGGVIINNSSIGGVRAMPNTSAYNATKFAINGLTRGAAFEYARQNIRVNAVCPSPVETRMIRAIEEGEAGSTRSVAEVKQAFYDVIPMGRYGRPEEIAQSVVFLASDEARFITGVCLSVDGGMSA